MKNVSLIVSFIAILFLVSCGGDDSFDVVVSVEGLGTQNVRAVYRTGDRVNVVPAMSLEGKFNFRGVSKDPVLIDIYTSKRYFIGHVIAKNGETVEVSYKLNEPGTMTVKGDKISVALAKFITDNASLINEGNSLELNDAIARYIGMNRDAAVSPFLLLSLYDSSVPGARADSLMKLISPELFPPGDVMSSYSELVSQPIDTLKRIDQIRIYTSADSLTTIKPHDSYGILIALSGDSDAESHDLLVKRLNDALDTLKTRAHVVEMSLVNDTVEWNGQIVDIKPRYTRGWMPGGVSSPVVRSIGVREVPQYVAVDSTGMILYSGALLEEAISQF